MTKHAKLSASGSGMWLNCPGSIKVQALYANESSIYADEGTAAHEVADWCLSKGTDADEYIGQTIDVGQNSFEVDKVMAGYVQEYVDYVRSFETADSILFAEDRVNFSHIVPEGFGTLDSAVLYADKGELHIFDLKYGQGVAVSAYENTQALLYAVGMQKEIEWLGSLQSITMHIIQPRKNSISDWTITTEELEEFKVRAKKAAELALTDDAPRIPGDKQCLWCKHKADCVELKEFTEQTITVLFDDLDSDNTPTPGNLTQEQKRQILDNKSLIEKFLSAVSVDVFQTIENGEHFPGYKLVQSKSNRKLLDTAESELYELHGDDIYEQKLIGLTKLDKLVGKSQMDVYTYKPDGKPVLVPESDPRPSLETITADEFDNLDED